MANDSKQYQEEEYLFSEDENADPLNTTQSSASTSEEVVPERESFWKIWHKNLMIGVVLIFVVFIVYKIIGSFFGHHEVKQISEIPAESSLKTALPQNLTSNVNAVTNTETGTSSMTLPDSVNAYNQNRQQAQQLGQLTQATQNIGNEVSSLQNTTQTLQTSVETINTQLSQINTAIGALTNQMQIQENRWLQSQKKPKPKLSMKPKHVVKLESYQTMAVIPGRAWLKSAKGATITVGVGTTIPGYGQVTKIETQSGRVVTSAGPVIAYAPNDE